MLMIEQDEVKTRVVLCENELMVPCRDIFEIIGRNPRNAIHYANKYVEEINKKRLMVMDKERIQNRLHICVNQRGIYELVFSIDDLTIDEVEKVEAFILKAEKEIHLPNKTTKKTQKVGEGEELEGFKEETGLIDKVINFFRKRVV